MMESWLKAIPLMQTGYHETLLAKVAAKREYKSIYPAQSEIFYALELTSFMAVKVVLLGQDPYHGLGQAHGLAFSVPQGVTIPPSLRNIYKEIEADIYHQQPQKFSPDLRRWAKQGVFLLNAALSVEAKKAGSHKNLGWHKLTAEIIAQLSTQREHVVFILWGAHARSKRSLIDPAKHLILETAHPSPLSAHRGFWGCKHFSKTNNYLKQHQLRPIIW